MHFVKTEWYQAIVPRSLPSPRRVVYVSGVAEIAGGLGVMHARTRMAAALWSIATLVAVFPANVNMAAEAQRLQAGGSGGGGGLLGPPPLPAPVHPVALGGAP